MNETFVGKKQVLWTMVVKDLYNFVFFLFFFFFLFFVWTMWNTSSTQIELESKNYVTEFQKPFHSIYKIEEVGKRKPLRYFFFEKLQKI